MKKVFMTVVSIALCVNFIFCSSSCTQHDSNKGSSANPPYSPPPEISLPEIETFGDDYWESIFAPAYSEHTYLVTYTVDLQHNHSVGNEWKVGVRYNDKYIESGSQIVLTGSSKRVELIAFATELDEWNDYGTTRVTFDALEVDEWQEMWATVVVVENEGRYSGNTAKWYFEIRVERLQ